MVERYDCETAGTYDCYGVMRRSDDGDYVRYDSYASLERERDALAARVRELELAAKVLLGRMRWSDYANGWEPNDLPGEKRITNRALSAVRDLLASRRDGEMERKEGRSL